jgi:endonuclease YncB( thermonuclease family)
MHACQFNPLVFLRVIPALHVSGLTAQGISRRSLVLVLLTLLTAAACQSASARPGTTEAPTPEPTPSLSTIRTDVPEGQAALRCPQCQPVEVLGVIDAENLETSAGRVRLYGIFVAPEDAECGGLARTRLEELAGGQVRLEAGAQMADRHGSLLRYVYTAEGESIDELMIRQGLARPSPFEGQHYPWMLIRADRASNGRVGCLWSPLAGLSSASSGTLLRSTVVLRIAGQSREEPLCCSSAPVRTA